VPRFNSQASWEFLVSASRNTLQSYELSRLGHAANLRKEIVALLDQWLEENAAALLARYLIDQRQHPAAVTGDAQVAETAVSQNGAAPDNFLAEPPAPPPVPVATPDLPFDLRLAFRIFRSLFAPAPVPAGVRRGGSCPSLIPGILALARCDSPAIPSGCAQVFLSPARRSSLLTAHLARITSRYLYMN
jgi:hypothetical protein